MPGCKFTENVFVDLIRINAYAKYPVPYFMTNTIHLALKPSVLVMLLHDAYQSIDILFNLQNMYTGMRSMLVAFNVSIALIGIISTSRHAD